MSRSDRADDNDESWLASLIADEERLDRREWMRLLAWGFCAVAAIAAGAIGAQIPGFLQREAAASLLASRTVRAEQLAADNGLEARRLAAAIETLNSDRDRLFTRLSSLEQSLDTVTGSIRNVEATRMTPHWPDAAAPPPVLASPPAVAPATETHAAATISEPSPPVSEVLRDAAEKPSGPKAASVALQPIVATTSSPIQTLPIPDAIFVTDGAETVARQTEFGLELGVAKSMDALRAMWRTASRKHKSELQGLRPLVVVRERRGGVDLHLVAGPIRDAAAAARLCAALIDAARNCETTIYDGQRLSLTGADAQDKGKRGRRKSARTTPRATPPAARPSSIASFIGLQ